MKYKTIHFKELIIPTLTDIASTLPTAGRLMISNNKLVYLDVDDDYINKLFPIIKKHTTKIIKPDYFGPNLAGAHISVIYPEENTFIDEEDLFTIHHFKIVGTFTALLGLKTYYVLTVESPSLIQLRHKYGLSHKLKFKKYLIDLHITMGTSW